MRNVSGDTCNNDKELVIFITILKYNKSPVRNLIQKQLFRNKVTTELLIKISVEGADTAQQRVPS